MRMCWMRNPEPPQCGWVPCCSSGSGRMCSKCEVHIVIPLMQLMLALHWAFTYIFFHWTRLTYLMKLPSDETASIPVGNSVGGPRCTRPIRLPWGIMAWTSHVTDLDQKQVLRFCVEAPGVNVRIEVNGANIWRLVQFPAAAADGLNNELPYMSCSPSHVVLLASSRDITYWPRL